MTKLILRWLINGAALYVAVGTGWIQGIHSVNDAWWTFLALGAVFAVVNALLRPLLKLLTCPLILLTLGLFTFVINAFLFWLTGVIGNAFPTAFGFQVESVWATILGAIVVSLVNGFLTLAFKDELKTHKPRQRRS
ncbi:MAG: phage holin family protein [Anaerolineales bacterium]|nr:phage holin family protein [Anaerolineales bacterium]